jgi:hypothetical protein
MIQSTKKSIHYNSTQILNDTEYKSDLLYILTLNSMIIEIGLPFTHMNTNNLPSIQHKEPYSTRDINLTVHK